ncbi:DUF805 domain-containing protein [Aurantiacibacter sp. MUD61]|uniref:DUF805 domain-containing protein n=1 Tax=Aurantiacibacter sp. MUD61 TaxID=3009083 RepID=UPI0022F129FE|nr:DUF805 domain-containing protein [Aurantiacibacter sp. MUD61]
MIQAIKYNLANLTNFSGRDARSTFWWYVLFIVIAQFVVGLLASIPLITAGVGTAMDAAQSGADQATMQAEMMTSMAGAMDTAIWVGVAAEIAVVLLLVASFVRRLHDSGNSGYWAAIPVVTQLAGVYGEITMVDRAKELMVISADPSRMDEMQALQAEMMAAPLTWVPYIGLIVIIVFGVMKSEPGANKYGGPPAV